MGGHGPQADFAFLMIPTLSEMWLHISTFHTSRSLASMPRRQAAASPARRPLPRAGEALASWPAPRAPSVPRAAVLFPTLPTLLIECYLIVLFGCPCLLAGMEQYARYNWCPALRAAG